MGTSLADETLGSGLQCSKFHFRTNDRSRRTRQRGGDIVVDENRGSEVEPSQDALLGAFARARIKVQSVQRDYRTAPDWLDFFARRKRSAQSSFVQLFQRLQL